MTLHDYFDLTKDEERYIAQIEKQRRDAQAWLDEPGIFNLPHPARVAASPGSGPDMTLLTLAAPKNQVLVKKWLSEGLSTLGIFQGLTDLDDKRIGVFHALHTSTAEMTGGFGNGTAGPLVQTLRFFNAKGRIFSFSDELVATLGRTKVGTDIPVSELRLPEPNIYIEFGTNRSAAPMQLTHAESGQHPIEGAYVSSVVDQHGQPKLEITFTGSPWGREEVLDDVIEWAELDTADRISIEDALVKAHTRAADGSQDNEYFNDQARLHERAMSMKDKLELLLKCILFLNVEQAHKIEVLDKTEAKKVFARAQSGAHRRRAGRQVARSYDRVLVSLPPAPDKQAADVGEDRRKIASHWRDPHFRLQRHGPSNSLTKVIWIEAMLINAEDLGSVGA